jgi:hypothetical protein
MEMAVYVSVVFQVEASAGNVNLEAISVEW